MSHANRGMQLEKSVKKLFEHYEQKGIWCHKLEVAQAQGNYVAKSPFDFLVYHKNTLHAFDTKNCNSGGLGIANFKIHQVKALTDVENNGGEAFFLVYFGEHKSLNKVPVADIRLMLQDGVKTVHHSEERKTKLDFLGIL